MFYLADCNSFYALIEKFFEKIKRRRQRVCIRFVRRLFGLLQRK